jgi:hypothetical protein
VERKKQKVIDEKNSKPMTKEEEYSKFMEFCILHKLDPLKVINAYQSREDMRIKLIESMCLNVGSCFLNYKESGSIDKTLVRLHLLKPKISGVYLTSEQWQEEINRPPKY